MTDTPTPMTDALKAGIDARRKARGFNMPEDLGDALDLCDYLECSLSAAEARVAGLEKALLALPNEVPNSWLDPLLTGDKAVLRGFEFDCDDVRNLLTALRARIQGRIDAALKGAG